MRKTLSSVRYSIMLLAVILFSTAFTPSVTKQVNLISAIANKTITAKITSSGNYSGNCVNIELTNNTNNPLSIISAGGTKFHPENEDEQTLIQLEDDIIVLKPKGVYKGKIAAFCTEASDRCPSEASTMRLSKNSNPKFDQLITYLKGKQIPKTTYQDAVWAISDNKSISNISNETKASNDFRIYMADLTGQKNTWYSSPQNVEVDNQGNFNYETVNINGALEFDCTKGAKVRQDVMKANGEPMFQSEKSMTAQSTHIRYRFRMSVRGWEKGEYYIKIHDGNQTLAKYEFSI